MDREAEAKEAAILGLLAGYPSFKATDEFINALLAAVEPYSATAVADACKRFADDGVPDHDKRFVINAAELAGQARLFDGIYNTVRVPLYSGILEMDFGHGRVDMRGLTVDEQDEIMRRHGIAADGRNMALLSLDEKREALQQKAVESRKVAGVPLKLKRF
jgi:hypothetical protein